MQSNRERNIISAGWAPGLLALFFSISMQLSLSPVQITSAQITPTDAARAIDTTVFSSDTGISVDNQLTSSILGQSPINATLTNSSTIIQSAVLPSQLPVTPVSSVSSIDDGDDNDDDNNDANDDDDRNSSNDNNGDNDDNDGNDDDNDDDRTRSSSDNGDDNEDSNRQSISIQRSEGGVSVSVG